MTFASAAFLAGLGLLIVPWWLHRLHAHTAERRTFSSLFLMRPSESPVNMHRQVQHWLLLALRWLVVATVCLAFAEPFIDTDVAAGAQVEEAVPHRVIVLDRSMSMGLSTGGGSTMDLAKQQARSLVSKLPAGAKAAVVSVADDIELVGPLSADRTQLTAAIAAIEAGTGRLLNQGLMGRIATIGETLAAPGERLTIHFISDFQASGLPDQFNALVEGSVWPLTLHPVSSNARQNWAVVNMRRVEADVASVEVEVRSYGADPATVTVSLSQNEAPVATREVFVPAGGSGLATFALPAETLLAGSLSATLELEDALAGDNVRHLVQAHAETTALPVMGESERGYAYLRAAAQSAAPRFVPTRVTRLEEPTAPVVVLVDPGLPRSAVARELQDYVRDGGGVVIAAGPATRAAGHIPVLDQAVVSDRFSQSARGVVVADRSHPVLGDLGAWQDVTVFQALTPVEDERIGEVILRLDDGTPLLTEYRLGAGRVLFFSSAFDPAWSSIVVRPLFVGLTANLLGYVAEDLFPAQALVGQPFAIPARSVQLFDAQGGRVLGLAQTVDRPTVRLSKPGVYQLRTPGSTRLLAVNPDPAESDLASAEPSLLARWQAASTGVPREITAPAVSSATEDSATQLESLAPWLLALLALLVFAEPVLSNTGWLHRKTGGARA